MRQLALGRECARGMLHCEFASPLNTVSFSNRRLSIMHLVWTAASFLGVIGFLLALAGLFLFAYAAATHVRKSATAVAWSWSQGLVPLASGLFIVGAVVQVTAFILRSGLADRTP